MSNIVNNLALIFNETDNIYVAGALQDSGGYSNPRLSQLSDLANVLLPEHQFYALNAISFNNRNMRADGTIGSYRASINVAQFRNFLLESDTLPLDLQTEIVPHLNQYIPIRLATFSGSKSIHMVISVADTLFSSAVKDPVALYKQVWHGLAEKAETHVKDYLLERSIEAPLKIFDTSTKDPARLSRLPGAMRGTIEQRVLHTGALVAADELLALSAEPRLRQYESKVNMVDNTLDVSTFTKRLSSTTSLSFLRDRLEYPDRWTANANMYTEMFRYTLWCIDATSVPLGVLDAYFTKKVYPAIIAKGYPRDPRAGVVAAYQYKGLL